MVGKKSCKFTAAAIELWVFFEFFDHVLMPQCIVVLGEAYNFRGSHSEVVLSDK